MNRNVAKLSFVFNLALGLALFFCLKNPTLDSRKEIQGKISPQKLERQIRNVTSTNSVANPAAKFDWRAIEADEYPTYIANLRAVRCPEKTIFNIIFADIEKLFAERKTKLEAPGKFWRTGDDLKNEELLRHTKLFELQEEKRALIKTLLNSEMDWEMMENWYQENLVGLFAGFLPDAKAEHALSVAKKFADRIEHVDKRAGDLLIPEDAEERKKIYAEMKSSLGGIGSSGELEEGELRLISLLSNFSFNNRMREAGLTGAQLRQIMQLKLRFQNPIDGEIAKYNGKDSSPEMLSKQKFYEEAKTFLGEARFQQFLRAQDEEFDDLCKWTDRNGLRPQVALGVFELQQVALLESARIREDRSLHRKEQRLELDAFAQSTREAIGRLLGEKAAANYSTNGGKWLKEFGKP